MTNLLVERLRAWSAAEQQDPDAVEDVLLLRDAADEIERLSAKVDDCCPDGVEEGACDYRRLKIENNELRQQVEDLHQGRVQRIAEYEQMRSALLAWYEACDAEERRWAMERTASLKELLRRGEDEPEAGK